MNRPGYGHWADRWYGNYIPSRYHGWYHGCWSGNWGNYWYVPMVAGATAWGLNTILPSWGYNYGYSYSNPYYVESSSPAYTFTQPILTSIRTTHQSLANRLMGKQLRRVAADDRGLPVIRSGIGCL